MNKLNTELCVLMSQIPDTSVHQPTLNSHTDLEERKLEPL